MTIIERFQKRLSDLESIVRTVKYHSPNKPFEWQDKVYMGYAELAAKYAGRDKPFSVDDVYRAVKFDLSSKYIVEYFLFFTEIDRVDYVYKDQRLSFTEFPLTQELLSLVEFYNEFIIFAY